MSKSKTLLYVGGLDENATEELLHAAFIPFGDIKSVQIMKDFAANKTRGFGFVEFELEEDAFEAMDNMDGSEILGKVIRVNFARPANNKVQAGKAIWNSDEYYNEANENEADPESAE